jgi:N-acyl homoserine lactone hydrolase
LSAATADRLWALPGATFTGMVKPQFVHGEMIRNRYSGARTGTMPCPSFLIEHRRGLVLFDTGISPRGLADPDHYFPYLVERLRFDCNPELGIDAQLRCLGIAPDRISYVIASHLHFDHAGGLYLFPGATFVVGRGELGFAYHPDEPSRHRYLLGDLQPTRNFRWVEVGADFDLFGDGSVQILLSPGHTPGSLALFVRLPQRNVILTGDTCHYQIEVEHGIADALHDQALGNASLRRLILIRDAWDAQIWVGHDPEDWATWPHSPQFVE